MKCINCKKEHDGFSWFCKDCYELKEKAYAKAKELGLNNHLEIMNLRDKALSDYLKNKTNQ